MSELLTSIVLLLTVPGSLGLREVRVRPQGIWLNVGDGRWFCIRLWSLLSWVLLLVYHTHTHTHTHTHSIYTSSGFPLSEATGTECFRFEIGLFCIFGGKIWRKILQEGRSKAHLCAFLLSSSLTNSYLSQKKKDNSWKSLWHLPSGDDNVCLIPHFSFFTLSSSLMFQTLQSIYSLVFWKQNNRSRRVGHRRE